jgi:hypothetical protein
VRSGQALLLVLLAACGSPDQVVLGLGAAGGDGDASFGDAGDSGLFRVVAFELVDVTTGADLRVLADGDAFNPKTAGADGGAATVRAVVQPPNPGSVVFAVDGTIVRTDDSAPYAISGADPQTGKLLTWTIVDGTHVVSATPYSAADGGGVVGIALQQTFKAQ